MQTITLQSNHEKPCSIHIGLNILKDIASIFQIDQYSTVFILSDDHIAPLLLKKLEQAISCKTTAFIIQSGEKQKNIENVQAIWLAMQRAHCDRKSLVINLGGGVITDLGGFAASTYMRGLDFINIPTSLLAQIDASVGGKNGINFGRIKNLIGTFNQPNGIVIDAALLKSLPERQLIAGFAEIIKHGLILDEMYFKKVTAKPPLQFSLVELADIILGSCQIKMSIVKNDTNELGHRKLLNFGHTVGHAVESLSLATQKPLLHGEAIGIGLYAEARLSQALGLLSETDLIRIKNSLVAANLSISIPSYDCRQLIATMRSDKKNVKQQLHFTLLNRIGQACIDQHVSASLVKNVLLELGAKTS